jgi:hypothetical protein
MDDDFPNWMTKCEVISGCVLSILDFHILFVLSDLYFCIEFTVSRRWEPNRRTGLSQRFQLWSHYHSIKVGFQSVSCRAQRLSQDWWILEHQILIYRRVNKSWP